MQRLEALNRNWFSRVSTLLVLTALATGCADPCARLLETLCKDMPHEQYCRSYREKVSSGTISGEMCVATRKAYVSSLQDEDE